MPTITTTAAPSTDIHFEDRGQGRPVVLIHGWPLSGATWESLVNVLVEQGFRCIAYDRRGFGRSGRPDGGYDYDTFASDLNDLATKLDLKDAALVGFSMGGGEVARYVGRYGEGRVSKAALVAAVTPFLLRTDDNPGGVPREVFDGMLAGVKKDRVAFFTDFVPNFYNFRKGTQDPAEQDVIAWSKAVLWPASAVGTQQCIVAFGTTDFRADLRRLTVPALVLHGDADAIVPIGVSGRRVQELVPHARLEVVKGAPHGMLATHAEQVNRVLLDFLKS
jgi:non-heme chloroperoxidase